MRHERDDGVGSPDPREQVARLSARVAELEREVDDALPRQLRAFIEAAPFGSHVYELHGDGRLIFVAANPAADRILGVDNHQFIGRTIEDAFPALTEGPIPGAYRRVAETGEAFETELVTYAEGDIAGAYEVSAFRIGPRRVAALFRDVTERAKADTRRRQAEEALRAREERFGALISHSTDIITLHDAEGRWLYQTPAAHRVMGYQPGEQLGRSPFDYIHPDDHEAMRRHLGDLLAHTGSIAVHEFRFRHANGSWRYLESVGQNLLQHPDVGAILITSRDVTERRLLRQELLQAQKMECVGRLAAGVAHDFNNVLSVVLGCAALIADEGLGEGQRAALDELVAAAEQGATLAGHLLTFSRREPTLHKPMNTVAEVRAATRILRRSLPHHVELSFDLPDDVPLVLGDPAQLLQVLMNLAINAGDAMPEGGRLVVAVSVAPAVGGHRVITSPVPAGPCVAIEVRDTGRGIPPDVLERLFEPFFTTKEAGRGTGLGLTICHGIVQQHQGAIAVDTDQARGTAFHVYLPVLERDSV